LLHCSVARLHNRHQQVRRDWFRIGLADGLAVRQYRSDNHGEGTCGEEAIVYTHLRFAAVVCLLSAGLLIGSSCGVIAAADSGASGADAHGHDSPSADSKTGGSSAGATAPAGGTPHGWGAAPHPQSTATRPSTTATKAVHAGYGDKESAVAATQSDPAASDATMTSDSTEAVSATSETASAPDVPASAPDSPASSADPVTPTATAVPPAMDTPTTVAEAPPATTDPVTSTTNGTGSDSSATAAVTNSSASNTNTNSPAATTDPAAPAANAAAPESNPVGPATNAAMSAATADASNPVVVAPVVTSPTPVSDVITTVQYMLTSVTEVVDQVVDPLITSSPCDLCSLLSLIAGDPAAISSARVNNGGPLAAENAPVLGPRASPFAQRLPTHGLAGLLLPGELAKPATLGAAAATGLIRAVAISGFTAPAPSSVLPPAGRDFLEHTMRAVLVPASLSALAAVALPGVGGLLIVCGAGVRLGYRQAKAGLAVQATAVARFAGSGVAGVARSGSLVALRPRTSRVVDRRAGPPTRLLDQAA
jgi:hypothetical protein